ncbi:hypothetical protein [Budvicia aquatica]|uniref:hypothetical protein n=1 Tax=Budvicia aquatica TaxID=82979 RepID=UPI003D15985B
MKLNVNGYQFAGNSGFPRTGYTNATYQIWMNGTSSATNNAYVFTSDSPWVSVGRSTGIITLTGKPASGYTAAVINIAATNGSMSYEHVVNPRLWGSVSAPARSAGTDGATVCPSPQTAATGTRLVGYGSRTTQPNPVLSIWNEWGSFAGSAGPLLVFNRTLSRVPGAWSSHDTAWTDHQYISSPTSVVMNGAAATSLQVGWGGATAYTQSSPENYRAYPNNTMVYNTIRTPMLCEEAL